MNEFEAWCYSGVMFDVRPRRHTSPLSAEQLRHFDELGWVGPFSLLSEQGVQAAAECHEWSNARCLPKGEMPRLSSFDAFTRSPWFKSLHSFVPAFRAICSHPSLAARLISLLGDDVMAWGVS